MKAASQSFQGSVQRYLIANKYLPTLTIDNPMMRTLTMPYVRELRKNETVEYNCEAKIHYCYMFICPSWLGADESIFKWGLLERWQRMDWFYHDQIKDSYRVIASHYPDAKVQAIEYGGRVHDLTADMDYRILGERQHGLTWDILHTKEVVSTTVEHDALKTLALVLEQTRIFTVRTTDFYNEFRQLLTE